MPRPSVGGYSSETFIGNELRSFCFLLDKKLYHCISAAPQVNPAPNPASKIKSFSLIFPSLFNLYNSNLELQNGKYSYSLYIIKNKNFLNMLLYKLIIWTK